MNWRFSNYGWRLLPGGLTTLIMAGLLHVGALQPFEQAAYCLLFQLRGAVSWDDRLVVIAIDDTSIERLGRFPWSRQNYVKLLTVLSAADPSVVAIDLVWSETSPHDEPLAQAIAKQGRVVLADAVDANGLPLKPVPVLQQAAIGSGHILAQPDGDGVVRRVDLQIQNEPALGLATVQAYGLVQQPLPLPNLDRPLWINWPGPVSTLRQYSFADVIQGNVQPQALQNKIVLVGVTATGIVPKVTPFNRSPPASGVFVNAAVVNNLLRQNALHPLASNWLWLVLGMSSLIWSVWLSDRRETTQILAGCGVCLGWGTASLWLFCLDYWLPVALPIGLCATTTVAVIIGDRLRMAMHLQGQIKQIWQQYHPDLVTPTDEDGFKPIHEDRTPGLNRSIVQLAALAKAFARSQSTQAIIARNLSIGVVAVDRNGVIWFCNPMATAWLQVQAGNHLSGLVPTWFSQEQWESNLQALQQQVAIDPREMQRHDRWLEIRLEPLQYRSALEQSLSKLDRDRAPQTDGFLLILEDITARKQVETALEVQIQELQRVAQLKDDFLSTVSHELRSPMTNIKMAIELLKISRSPESSAHYLKILQNECARETNLINDLLDLQRLEAGAQTYTPAKINLQDWLPPIIQGFSERAEAQHQHLYMELPAQLPALVSDQPSLERIVVELVNNACKYTPPEGEIKVAVNWASHHVELVVENSGSEIPEAEMSRIFEKFYRVPQADPWKRGGTGLGLALVKKLVEYLGGQIRVNSSAGHTTFTVQLPVTTQHSTQ